MVNMRFSILPFTLCLVLIPRLSLAQSGTLAVSLDGHCGASSEQTCLGSKFGNCCSANGFCGSGSTYCGSACQGDYGTCYVDAASISSDGNCGPKDPNNSTCLGSTFGNCCSQNGFCGATDTYCGTGCQAGGYGVCGDSNVTIPTTSPSSSAASNPSSSATASSTSGSSSSTGSASSSFTSGSSSSSTSSSSGQATSSAASTAGFASHSITSSTGFKAGMGVLGAVLGLAVIGAIFFLAARRKKQTTSTEANVQEHHEAPTPYTSAPEPYSAGPAPYYQPPYTNEKSINALEMPTGYNANPGPEKIDDPRAELSNKHTSVKASELSSDS